MKSNAPVGSTVSGIGFSFYLPEQAREVSVKQISNSPAFDVQGECCYHVFNLI